MKAGINLAEEGHVVNILPCDNINGGAVTDVFSMENYAHASILVRLATATVGATVRITVDECDDFTPTNSTPIAFGYYQELTAGGDTLGARAAAGVAGLMVGSTEGQMAVIEIDDSELSDGYPNLQVTIEDPGSCCYVDIVAILTGARYKKATTQTAIA